MNCPMGCPAGYVCHQYHAVPPGFFVVLAIGIVMAAPLGWLLGKFLIWRDDRAQAKRANECVPNTPEGDG